MDFLSRLFLTILKDNKRHKRWRVFTSALAGVVVFSTSYMLILPAITMSTAVADDEPGVYLEDEIYDDADLDEYFEDVDWYDETSDDEFFDDTEFDGTSDEIFDDDLDGDEWEDVGFDEEPDADEGTDEADGTDMDAYETEDADVDAEGSADADGTPVTDDADVIFETDEYEFANDAAYTITELTASIVAAQDESQNVDVRLTFDASAMIADGTELTAEEIQKDAVGDAERYAGYADAVNEAVFRNESEWSFLDARFFDLRLLGADGTEVEPCGNVTVEFTFAAPIYAERLQVVHFDERDGGALPAALENIETDSYEDGGVYRVTFETGSFSVFGVVTGTAEKTEQISEDENSSENDSAVEESEEEKIESIVESVVEEVEEGDAEAEEFEVDSVVESVVEEVAEYEAASVVESVVEEVAESEAASVVESVVEEMADTEDAVLYPAQEFSASTSHVHVQVYAGEGAFPEGTTMTVEAVDDEETMSAITDAAEESESRVRRIYAIDISFWNAGQKIEPAKPIRVEMTAEEIGEDEKAVVVHVDDEGNAEALSDVSVVAQEDAAFAGLTEDGNAADAEPVAENTADYANAGAVAEKAAINVDAETATDAVEAADTVVFESDSFSIYAIVYTVDFSYSVDGSTYDFSLSGGESITLSELIEVLGILQDTNSAIFETVEDFVKEVEGVEFSDESLIKVTRMEDDWELQSLAPFSTEEELTITMKNGDVIVIHVTDASEVSLIAIARTEEGISVSENSATSSDEYSRSGTYTVHIAYAIDNSMLALARANNTWVYDLSDFFSDPSVPFSGFPEGLNQSGPIIENNTTKGRYYISGDKIYLEMNQSYINTHTDITGTLDITLQLDETKIGTTGSSTFTFPGSTDELTITYKSVDVTDGWKSVSNRNIGGSNVSVQQQADGTYKLNYTVTARPNAALTSLVMEDTLGAGQTVDKSSFVIKAETGQTYTVPVSAINETTSGFSLDIASIIMAAGDSVKSGVKYEVQYSTNVDSDKVDGQTEVTNQVKWTWDSGNTDTSQTTVKPTRATSVSKDVTAAEDGSEEYIYTFTYTITVGDSSNTDVSGVTVTDYLQDYQILDGSSITVSNSSGTVVHTMSGSEVKWTDDDTYGDNQKLLFEYTFPENSNQGPYTIIYTTRVPANVGRGGQVNVTNTVNTSDGGSDSTGYPVDFGTLPSVGASIDKRFESWKGIDNEGKVTAVWAIDVNVASDAALPLSNVVVTEASCFTAPSGWYPKTDASIDYTSIVVRNKETGEVMTSGYTVDASAGTITFSELNNSVTIELQAESAEAMPENGWFENSASLTVDGKPAGSDKDDRQYGSTTFDKSVSYDEDSEVFTWTVTLNSLRNTVDPDVPVYFSDLLPEGMQMLNYASGTAGTPSIHISTGGSAYMSWDQDVTVVGREVQRENITVFTDYSYTTHKDAGLSGIDYTITYKTKLTASELASFADDEDASKTYLNTAFYYTSEDGDAEGQAAREVSYEYMVLDKKVTNVTNDLVHYEIYINPKAVRLNDGQEMTLVDTLITTNVDLLLDSVRLLDGDGNGIAGASVVYNDDLRTLTITVPDETYVIVHYDVITQSLGTQTLRNVAQLNGRQSWSEENISTQVILSHSATTSGSGNVSLTKIDENYVVNTDGSTSPKPLSGAEFALYIQPIDFTLAGSDAAGWTGSGTGDVNGDAIRVNRDGETDSVFTSASDGSVLFDGITIQKYDTLYYWEEITAPEGYALDSTKHYFVMYDSDEDEEVEKANKDHADILDDAATRRDQGIIINKVATGSSWTVINKTDGLVIEVTKAWKDASGSDKILDSDTSVYFKLYQAVGDANGVLYTPTSDDVDGYLGGGVWQIDYRTATDTWSTVSISGLPELVNDAACSYYVVEVNQDGSALSSRKDYIVSYKAGSSSAKQEAEEAALSRNGSIIITNSDMVTVTAAKEWSDNNNADGIRPTSITLHLVQDGKQMDTAYDRHVEDDGAGNWITEWTGLESGHTYTVTEDQIAGYAVSYSPSEGLTAGGEIIVHNTDNRAQLSVVKEWVDRSGSSIDAPENVSVTVRLKKDNVIIDTQAISAPDWQYTWKLTDYDETAVYTIEEDEDALPNGFSIYGSTTYENEDTSIIDRVVDGGTAIIKNSPATEEADKTQLVVQKQWIDDDGEAMSAAEAANQTATVQLVQYKSEKSGTTVHFVYLGGGSGKSDETGIAATSTITIEWTNNIERGAATESGYQYDWQVNNNAISGTSNLWGTKNNSLSFSNNNYSDIYIYFMQDPGDIVSFTADHVSGGTPVGPTVVDGETLTLAAPNFSGQFYNLPTTLEDGGTAYNLTYAVEEISVDGFTTQYSVDGENFEDSIAATDALGGAGTRTITVKNTHIPVETELSVQKNWVTTDGAAWPSGATVQVTLMKTVNGEKTAVTASDLPSSSTERTNPVTLTASKTSTTWNHLPVKELVGETEYDISYSVEETAVNGVNESSFTTETVVSTNGKSAVIANTEQVDILVSKSWTPALDDGDTWSADFTLKQQKRLLLVDGAEATTSEIMAVDGVDAEGWSSSETVQSSGEDVTVTLSNGKLTDTIEGLPVSYSDESGSTFMLRYTLEETALTVNDVPSLTLYNSEASFASPENSYESIEAVNTLTTVDVPVEKKWDAFSETGSDWSVTMRLQWAPIYEADGETSANTEFVDYLTNPSDPASVLEKTITKAMMENLEESAEARSFANLPKYGSDTVKEKPFRYQYSLEEMSYTATKDGTTYTFTHSTTEGVADTYTGDTEYVPFYPHDAGELASDDSDYYIQAANYQRSSKDEKYISLTVRKTWEDEILDDDDAYATFAVKYNKRVDYRDISQMTEADKAADPITVKLVDTNGKEYDTITVQPHTGLRIGVTLLGHTSQVSVSVSGGDYSGAGNTIIRYYNTDKETVYFDGKAYPASSCTITLSDSLSFIDSAWLSDTTAGNVTETGVTYTTFTLNKGNHWSTILNLLSAQTIDGGDSSNENVEVYEYYLEEVASNPDGYAATFYTYGTDTENGDQYNVITKDGEVIEARNQTKAKLQVKKQWRGVPDATGYPDVTFTLYQCYAGCDNVGNAWIYQGDEYPYEGASSKSYTGIPLKYSDDSYTWTCPEVLPLRAQNGTRYAYFVVEDVQSGNVDGTQWELYGYSQGYASDGTIIANALSSQPYNAQLVGNDGTLMIHNELKHYHEMDVKKQYFMIKEDGSWYNVTADLTSNVVLGFKVIRRVVSQDGNTYYTGWKDYGEEMLVGYDSSGGHIESNEGNDFYLYYAGLWHWTIHQNGGDLNSEHIGLPLEGFYTDPDTGNTIAVKYQYSFRETGVYKDLNRTAYPEWEWFSTIVPDRYMDQNGGQVTGEFGLAFPNQDGERVANYQASDLLVTKRWLGKPTAQEVYVKVYRVDDEGSIEDFTAAISKDIRGDYDASHPAYGNSNWQGYLEDTSEIDASAGHEWLVLSAEHNGDWTSRMKVHNVLIRSTGVGSFYTYYIEEVGYKDDEGVIHMKGDDPDPFVDLETHYTRWVGGTYGHWEVNPLTDGADKSISIGAIGENRLQVMNAPKMDLTVQKKWLDADGNEIEPWTNQVKFQIEQVSTKWVQGAPTSQTRTSLVTIDGQDTFTMTGTAGENAYWTIDVSDHEGLHNSYAVNVDESSTKGEAWKFYVDGLYEGYFDANNDEWHCVYTIKEVEVLKSDVTIVGNNVSTDGQLVTIRNVYSDTGSVKISKSFTGIDALPDEFMITASWFDGHIAHSLNLKTSGEQPENVTLSGDGSPQNPYVWTIAKIPVATEVNVSFTEEAYTAEGYDVIVSSTTDATVDNDHTTTTVAVTGDAINKGNFTNTYSRLTGGIKVTKKVTVNNAATTGTLADGEYTFRLFEEDGITQAVDQNGETVEDFSVTITNGAANTIEIDNLLPGTYKVMEINGTNPAVMLDYTQYTVVAAAKEYGDDIQQTGIATITNNLPTVEVRADKRWIDGDDQELEEWPTGTTVTFGVFAGTSSTPLAFVELDGSADTVPADGDAPVGYEADRSQEKSGGMAIFKNLPQKDSKGRTIVYTIKEIAAASGFENQTPNGVANGGTITNKAAENEKSFEFTKLWRDATGSAALEWPANTSITVTVKQNDTEYAKYTINRSDLTVGAQISAAGDDSKPKLTVCAASAENGYAFKLEGLPYGDEPDGDVYTVSESALDEYQSPKYYLGGEQKMGAQQIGNGGTIKNDQIGRVLPNTGGMGTNLFTTLGSILALLAGALLVIRRRKYVH